ncbi:MAG: hypothetical protein K2K29_02955, partial [Muribaculaceae bacterium]|nr:hypothetical protein [Muribaculaceae bacterium]
VSDATTFYLKPGEKEFSVRLPKMQKGGNVTLNYCDNPFWYVLTSLSGNLAPDSESALEQTVALYSVATSAGMLAKYPRLREGVKSIFADDNEKNSITLSALNKNQSLKIASINSTPWVNNAQSETMRMQGLDFLLDDSGVKKVVENAIVGLEKTRNSNGSWSWMKGMPESLWITRQVLTGLGELYTSGYMPTDTDLRKKIETMIHDGIKYTDAEESKMYREVVTRGKGRYSLESELDYLYMRSNAGAPAAQGLIADMERDMYNRLPKEWRSLDLDNKMIASILLQRHGNHELARTILESVRQYASYKADKGMWFDGASQSWFAPSPLLLTSRCLTAYLAVDPENAAVEELVQYLVLSRQTTDWNLELGQAGVASVVNSVVRAVKDEYIADGGDADINPGVEIWLGNKRIDLPARREMLTGTFCLDIDAEEASGAEFRILRRNSSPARGGVVKHYAAPIREVRAHSVPQLKITKALLPMAT